MDVNEKHERKRGDVLHTYFNGGPVSIDEIEPHLYLGNLTAAKDVATLLKYKISHIVTIDTCPLPRMITEEQRTIVGTKYIQLSDQPKEDLLSHFDETYAYLRSAIDGGGTVFVHCYFGVSRSASVVVAYLMRHHELTYNQAMERARARRSLVCPNPGFVSQLKLYKEMGWRVNRNHMKYKLFRLGMAADRVKKAKILPKDYYDLVRGDPGQTQTQPEPNVYRCKKCRRVLAGESNLLVHTDQKDPEKFCTRTYFIEPLWWMANITQTTQSKLHCPQCQAKVGSFSWIMGCQCQCGQQVAPAFYLTPSRVDWTNVVKNIEVTI